MTEGPRDSATTNSEKVLRDSWRQERAFRVGMVLARLGAVLSILGALLNIWFIDSYVVWGDLMLLFGCISSIVFTDPRHGRKFVWWPMYFGYAIAIALTLSKTGGIASPFLGSFLALLLVGLLVVQTRIKPWVSVAFSCTYLIGFYVLEQFYPVAARATQPALYAVLMNTVVFCGIIICLYGFLRTEQELAREFDNRYRELFETRASLTRQEAASAAKTNFLANISHELRTPLGAILGYVELLQEGAAETEKGEFLDIVKRNGVQLSKLVDDLLDLSKVEAGRLEVERVPFNPLSVFEEVLDLFSLLAEKKRIRLQVNYLNPIPEKLLGDPARLKQILVNVVGNAIKFTEEGGVTISVQYRQANEKEASQLFISISDTGRGLAASEREKLFQPFTQADASMSRKYGGTGLGLSLSKKLAKLLGGDLQLTFSEPGAGSVFSVTVHADRVPGTTITTDFEQPSEKPNLAAVSESKEALRNLRVLVVDDTADNRSLLTRFIKGAGGSVDLAVDGAEGIQKALSNRYDVVLMDIQMPGLDGLQATTALRQKGYRAPILALTAHAMKQDRERCIQAGCNDHLAKPVQRNELIRRVEMWAHRHHSKQTVSLRDESASRQY